MSNAVLYTLFKQIPNATDEQVAEAVESVASAKEVATKSDIKDMATKADLAKLKDELTWRLVIALGVLAAILKLIPDLS